MKKIIFFVLLSGLLLSDCANMPLYYTKEPVNTGENIAILTFSDYMLEANNSGRLFTNLFTIYFLKYGFSVAEREKIDQILDEAELDLSGLTDETAREMGSLLNVDYILAGSVIDYTSYSETRSLFYIFEWLEITCTVSVTCRLIDVLTGEVVWVGVASEQAPSFKEAGDIAVAMLFETIEINE